MARVRTETRKVAKMEEKTLGRKAAVRKEAKGKRKAAREKPERVGRAARQDTSQPGAGKEETRTCTPWTKMTVRTPKSRLKMQRICNHGVCWKSEREWQEVISRRDKQRATKANQASLLSVDSSHSSSPKKIVEVKDR